MLNNGVTRVKYKTTCASTFFVGAGWWGFGAASPRKQICASGCVLRYILNVNKQHKMLHVLTFLKKKSHFLITLLLKKTCRLGGGGAVPTQSYAYVQQMFSSFSLSTKHQELINLSWAAYNIESIRPRVSLLLWWKKKDLSRLTMSIPSFYHFTSTDRLVCVFLLHFFLWWRCRTADYLMIA